MSFFREILSIRDWLRVRDNASLEFGNDTDFEVEYDATNDQVTVTHVSSGNAVTIDSTGGVSADGALTTAGAANVNGGGANGTGAVQFANTTIRETSAGEIEVVDSAGTATVIS